MNAKSTLAYRPDPATDRWKALAGVIVVHIALGAAIIAGLGADTVSVTAERLQTFDIALPKAPYPPLPPPKRLLRHIKTSGGVSERSRTPSPIVAPEPVLPVQSPALVADVAGTASASSVGAGGFGASNGSGGSGSGTGNGTGAGEDHGVTAPERLTRIPETDYYPLARTSGMQRGRVGMMLTVQPDGAVSNCRIFVSSGSRAADKLMCKLTLRYVRCRPARDHRGRPTQMDVGFFSYWEPIN